MAAAAATAARTQPRTVRNLTHSAAIIDFDLNSVSSLVSAR